MCSLTERATQWAGEVVGEYSDEGEKLIIELVAYVKELEARDISDDNEIARLEDGIEALTNKNNALMKAAIAVKNFADPSNWLLHAGCLQWMGELAADHYAEEVLKDISAADIDFNEEVE